HPEWLPGTGTRRERLAAWITHPDNRRLERATANRIWGLMFGKPFHAPVDDLPDPTTSAERDVLDLLGSDFRAHHCDLRRMIRVIAASRPFQLDSAGEDSSVAEKTTVAMDSSARPRRSSSKPAPAVKAKWSDGSDKADDTNKGVATSDVI